MKQYFVEVILPLALDKTFTYEINVDEFRFIKPGMRLAVPFGKSKIYTALAVEVHQIPPTLYEAKEIFQILDENPVVTDIQIRHWKWIASYYMCSIGEVYRAAIPSAMLLESETWIKADGEKFLDSKELSDDEYLVMEALRHQSMLRIQDITLILDKKNILPVINQLLEKQLITIKEEIYEKYKPKQIKHIRLQDQYQKPEALSVLLTDLKKTKKQADIILSYFQWVATEKNKPLTAKKLSELANTGVSPIKSLIDKGILEEFYLVQDRMDFEGHLTQLPTLSEDQNTAFLSLQAVLEEKEVCLFHGVTSSGKTEIYSELIAKTISQGKQVLFLVPEIALTTQLLSRLRVFFGNNLAVYHSKYSQNERVEVWRKVLDRSEKAQIVIGARSALFLPFSDLGLIIVDEEHEQNFKQNDPAPRYHAKDAAIVLASYYNAKVVLGSATPSLESYYNASKGKFGLVELSRRYGDIQLPEIMLVDLKDSYFRKKMQGHFSLGLLEEIQKVLSAGEQVILFQNRRGYSPLIECMTCGHVPQCPQCDVSLTFHKYRDQLRCHYCGHAIAKPTHCHSCSSSELTTKGFGTEQIEIELSGLFNDKKIHRMDQDTTRGKFGYEKILTMFQNREIDILVGTQMLAKGLDFDNVGLVGIMNADNMLFYPDFRAYERSFQMMVQVAGRAGRSGRRGKVVIQTFNPDHDIIRQVTQYNFHEMFNQQLYERNNFKYPPFYRLIKLTLKHKDFERLKEGAFWFYGILSKHMEIPVLGPEEPLIGRIRNEYIREIMIKIPPGSSISGIKEYIRRVLKSFETIAFYRPIKVTINVDVY